VTQHTRATMLTLLTAPQDSPLAPQHASLCGSGGAGRAARHQLALAAATEAASTPPVLSLQPVSHPVVPVSPQAHAATQPPRHAAARSPLPQFGQTRCMMPLLGAQVAQGQHQMSTATPLACSAAVQAPASMLSGCWWMLAPRKTAPRPSPPVGPTLSPPAAAQPLAAARLAAASAQQPL
jgi:hypothetical protein